MSKKQTKILPCTIYVRIDGELHRMDEFSPEEQKKIGEKLNRQGMEAMGFTAVEKKGTA